MEEVVSPVIDGKTRKRKRDTNSWKKNVDKCNRHKPSGMPVYPVCSHEKGLFLCKTLSMCDIKEFHSMFYSKYDKQFQDNFILKHIEVNTVKRKRPKTGTYDERLVQCKYFVRNLKKELVRVCLKCFVGILNVSRFRLNRIAKSYHDKGYVEEKRGGFKSAVKYQELKDCVMEFINRFQINESHYCRGKRNRKYLSSDLNITKMYKMYVNEPEMIPVKESFFRMVFNTNYNIGFGSPRTDVCSQCLQLDEKVKMAKDEVTKSTLRFEKSVHIKRANAFYDKLREDQEDLLIISYDCQKNLPLPKIPDQSTYYSRQIYFYNFTVVKGHSKCKLTRENVTSYCWMENQFSKGANTIASCLYDVLVSSDFSNYKSLRLVSDGCSGQNKNSILITMCHYWLANNAPPHINEIEIVFPVTGHSFIPPDKVFAYIEKEIRGHETILTFQELTNIVSAHSTVKKFGQDCALYNFKDAMKNVIKNTPNWHFQVSKIKRIYIKKTRSTIHSRGELFYLNDSCEYRSLFMKKKTAADLVLLQVLEGNVISTEKKHDVAALLTKHFGDKWQDIEKLSFFSLLINEQAIVVDELDNDCIESDCEFVEELPNQII